MKARIFSVSGFLLCGALSFAVAGCDNGTSDAPGSAGAAQMGGAGAGAGGGSGGGAVADGTPVKWDMGGWVDGASNTFKIQGPWYSYDDCKTSSGAANTLPCTMRDASLTGPDASQGWSVTPEAVCFKGTAVKVQDSASFPLQWGAGLALDLNSTGGLTATKSAFDAKTAGITGFSVDITGTAPSAGIRINLTMDGVPDSNFVPAAVPSTTTFKLGATAQGSWVKTKTALDPSKIMALQFQVFTNDAKPTPFDFCITAIRALTN